MSKKYYIDSYERYPDYELVESDRTTIVTHEISPTILEWINRTTLEYAAVQLYLSALDNKQ